MLQCPPRSPLFPYTTLFRSRLNYYPASNHSPSGKVMRGCGVEHQAQQRMVRRQAPSTIARADDTGGGYRVASPGRSEEHTSELQSRLHLVCRLLLEKKKCAD